jgi:hypothetical protein
MTSRQAAQAALKHWRLTGSREAIVSSLMGNSIRSNDIKYLQSHLTQDEVPYFVAKVGQRYWILWGIHCKVHMASIDQVYESAKIEFGDTSLFPLVDLNRTEAVRKMSQVPKLSKDREKAAELEEQLCESIYKDFMTAVKFATDKSYASEGDFARTLKTLGW